MGFAILWIVLFHSNLSFGATVMGRLFGFFKDIGYCGVDLFFFLSGLGLMYGWCVKKYPLPVFYKRRILRIIPIYWTVVSIHFLYQGLFTDAIFTPLDIINQLFFLDFFINRNLHLWFIPSILLLYIVFPVLSKIMLSVRDKIRCLLILIGACIIASLLIIATHAGNFLLIGLVRLPSFLIGMYIGYLESAVYEQESVPRFLTSSRLHMLFVFTGLVSLFVLIRTVSNHTLWTYGLWWYPGIILSFPFCFLFSIFLNRMASYSFIKAARSLLTVCGKYSFEIYLTHTLLFDCIIKVIQLFENNLLQRIIKPVYFEISGLILMIFTAVMIGKGIKGCIARVSKPG